MKPWITIKDVLIAFLLAELAIVAIAFWFSDGICFYRGNVYSYCSVTSEADAMAAFKLGMPKSNE